MTDGTTPGTPPPPPAPAPGAYGAPPAPSAAPPPAAPPPKKGLSALAWVGIGCGALLLIALLVTAGMCYVGGKWVQGKAKELEENPNALAMTGIEYAIRADPDLELVESDREAGTFTIRKKSTGEETTVDISDWQSGNVTWKTGDEEMSAGFEEGEDGGALTVRDKEGNTQFRMGAGGEDDVPAWVPRYPRATAEGAYVSSAGGKTAGGFTFVTDDPAADVQDHYADELGDAGFTEASSNSVSQGQGQVRMISYEGDERQIQITTTPDDDGRTRVAVTFSGPT